MPLLRGLDGLGEQGLPAPGKALAHGAAGVRGGHDAVLVRDEEGLVAGGVHLEVLGEEIRALDRNAEGCRKVKDE